MSSHARAFAVQPILCTDDIERLSSFYTDLFGAEERMRVPGAEGPFMVVLGIGEAGLGIVDYEKGAKVEPGRVTLAVFVENIDDLVPQVEPAGGTLLGPPNDMPWGHRVVHTADPHGNKLNLTQQL